MLKIFDKNHNAIGHIVKYKDCKIESELSTGDKTLYFTYLAKHHSLENEMYVRTKDDEYVIKEVPGATDSFPQIVAVLNLEDLQKDMWQTFSVTDVTIDEAVRTVLAGTGWTIGECNVTKRRNAGMMQVSSLEVIQNLCKAFMCEPVFDTINKKVSFYVQRGEDKGVYFMSGLNLKKLQKKSTSYDYYTRIIPIGANGLTIESVNDRKNYLENYQYSNKVLTYIWKDESYTDAQALKDDAELKLNDLSKPTLSYSADVRDLAKQKTEYAILSYSLGDNVTLIDRETGTRDKQRIVKLVEYPQDPEKNTCELANTVLTFEEMQQKVQEAASIINFTIAGDGRYTGTINVSDILHFEQGVAGSTTISGINSSISSMQGDLAQVKITVGEIDANYIKADEAELKYATIENLNVTNETVHSIQGDYASFKSTVTNEFAATTADITNLTGRFSTFEQTVTDELITAKGWMAEGSIGSAQISSVDANKIKSGTIDTAIVTIAGSDGRLQIADNTMQISDTNRVRVQVGKDASGDYTLAVWDSAGKLIWDALGATENTIQRKIIRDKMVADDAAIQALKLDLQSFNTALTNQGVTISGTVVQVGNKTLNVAMTEQTQLLTEHGETLTDHATRIEANENAISLRVTTQVYESYKSTVDGEIASAKSRLSTAESSITALNGQIVLKVEQTDIDAAVKKVDDKFANYSTTTQMNTAINQKADSITQSVSATYATKSSLETANSNITLLTSRMQTAESKLTKDGLTTIVGDYYTATTYASFNGNGSSQLYCWLCQIKTNSAYINTPTVIEINQRGYGYSLCEIKFNSEDSTDPSLYSIRKTGTPEWRIAKSAASTWDVYVKKSEAYDGITVTGFTKGAVPSVTWKCENADIPSGTTIATQLAGMYGVDSTSGGTSGSNSLITSGAVYSKTSAIETIATQAADHFNWLVKSGTSSTDFTLTDRTASLVANYINLNGLVTFDGLSSSAKSSIVDSVQVGGRNLLVGTNQGKYHWNNAHDGGVYGIEEVKWNGVNAVKMTCTTATASWRMFLFDGLLPNFEKLEPGGTYTLSYDVAGSIKAEFVDLCDPPATNGLSNKFTLVKRDTTNYGYHYEYRIVLKDSLVKSEQYVYLTNELTDNTEVIIANLKLEIGNKATDWTPAPEDVDSSISTAQSTADTANSTANSVKSTVDAGKSNWDSAYSWTSSNGSNMTSLLSMVKKWTNNAVSDTTTINGGWIATNTITADKIAIGDFTNYSDLKPETASKYGFTVVADSSASGNPWLQLNTLTRDTPICPNGYTNYKCNGGETFRIKFQVSSTVQGTSETDASGAKNYLYINVGLYGHTDTGATSWSIPTCGLSDASGTVRTVNTTITLPSNLREFSVYLQLNGYNFTGTCKVRNISVTKMSSGELIVDGAITTDKLATNAIKSKNYAYSSGNYSTAGTFLDLSNGLIRSKNFAIDSSGNAYLKGTITATSGKIGKYDITSTYLKTGSGSTATGIGGNQAFWAGSESSNSAPFRVAYDGTLVATNATISGNITATSGSFTGTVNANSGTIGDIAISGSKISYDSIDSSYGTLAKFEISKTQLSYGCMIVKGNSIQIGRDQRGATFTDGDDTTRIYGDFMFQDYSDTMRRPVASTGGDNSRVSCINSNLSNGVKIYGQWGVTGASYSAKTFTASSSDIRLKENIRPTEVNALSVINQMGLYQFDWKRDGRHQKIGFVADYLEQHDEHLAIGGGYDEDGNMDEKVVNDFYLMGYAIKGIQELSTMATRADARLADVEVIARSTQSEMDSLKSQVSSLQYQLEQAYTRIATLEKQLQAAG